MGAGRGIDGTAGRSKVARALLVGLAHLAPALFLAFAGCHREEAPPETVIAKVGTEKITEPQFREMVRILLQETGRVDEFLDAEEHRGQRNEFLSRYIDSKRIVLLAKEEGLEGDPNLRLQIEEAVTGIYAQALLQRRIADQGPTDEQMKGIYNELVAAQKAKGVGVPPFEEAKPYLPQLWKQKRQSEAEGALMKEIRVKYPATYADGYKSMNDGQ
jgi:hypothetical protein